MLKWIVHQANSCWRSPTCTLFSFKLRPPQAHHFPVLLNLTGSILSALTPVCCSPQWISHGFLREVPWSHPQTLHYRWSKRLSARPRHGSILGFCELMQRRFPWGGWLGSEVSSSGQTSFLVNHVCVNKESDNILMPCGQIYWFLRFMFFIFFNCTFINRP